MAHRMVLNETSYFGAGSLSALPQEITQRGFQKVLVVTDQALLKHGVAGKVTHVLEAANIVYDVYSDVKQNPAIENVQHGVKALAESGADCIVVVGGGSPIDTAKAMGIIHRNPEFSDVRSLEGVAPTKHTCLPIIALPTTAGTAAEVTINYVITDVERKRKFVCIDPHDIPIVAIVDPDLMASMPKGLIAATGMDALTHAIESYITQGAWAMSDMFALQAIELISSNLRQAVAGDAGAREAMSLAQYVAGMGFSNVGLGLVHGMAHPLGAFYDTPHGVANAILLPIVMAFNAPMCGEKYRAIARAMGVPDVDMMSLEHAQDAAVLAVAELSKDVGIPSTLGELGVKAEDLRALAEAAKADVCTPGNPKNAEIVDIEELYMSIL